MPITPILQVPFKGRRAYLQSADMWNAVLAALGAAGGVTPDTRIVMTFRRLLATAPRLDLPDPGQRLAPAQPAPVDVIVGTGPERRIGRLLATEQPVAERIDDTEDTVFAGCRIDGDTIHHTGPGPSSVVETIVAATKRLHQRTVSADVKWLATRLDFAAGLAVPPAAALTVRITHRTAGLSTRSTVAVDGADIGTIQFGPQQDPPA